MFALSLLRQLSNLLLSAGARIFRSTSAADTGAQQQTRRPLMLPSIDGTDRRTYGWTYDRYIHRSCSAYCTSSVGSFAVEFCATYVVYVKSSKVYGYAQFAV